MNIKDYAVFVQSKLKPMTEEMHLLHMRMGIKGELGELVDAYKKHLVYGKVLDRANVREELGDVIFYCVGLLPNTQFSIYNTEVHLPNTGLFTMLSPTKVMGLILDYSTELEETAHKAANVGVGSEKLVIILSELISYMGFTVEEVLQTNVDKLSKRYKGAYSDAEALNRDVEQERAILEKNL